MGRYACRNMEAQFLLIKSCCEVYLAFNISKNKKIIVFCMLANMAANDKYIFLKSFKV